MSKEYDIGQKLGHGTYAVVMQAIKADTQQKVRGWFVMVVLRSDYLYLVLLNR